MSRRVTQWEGNFRKMGLGLCVLDREAREEMKAERNEGWAVKIWTRTSAVGMDI